MKATLFVVFALCLVVAAAGPSSAQIGRFAGSWVTTNPNTAGMVGINITVNGTAATVHAFGACHPKPCDWGSVDAIAYGPNSGANLIQTANSMTAVYTTSFSVVTLVIVPRGGDLQVLAFTHFTDNSHRTDYREEGTFRRRRPGSAPDDWNSP